MEWQQLEYFRAVALTEHFTKAADRLAISQPALSRAIRQLEAEVGTPLFDRVGRAVRLNAFGRIFLKRVERALDEIQLGIREVKQLNDPLAGSVSLAFLLTIGLNILPEIIGRFTRKYPRIEFRLFQNTTPLILNLLKEGEVDLCLVGRVVQQPGIGWRNLVDEELFAYLPAGHRLAGRTALRLAELAAEPFISFKKGVGLRLLIDRFCEQAGFEPQVKFEGDDAATVVGLVSSGLGVTLLPAFSGMDAVRVKRIPVTEPLCRREIGLAWLEGRTLSPAALLFRDYVIRLFRRNASRAPYVSSSPPKR